MKTSTRVLITTAVLLAGVAIPSSAIAQTPPGRPPRDPSAMKPAETGTAIVRGRVVAADTGLPVRRAIVSLRNVRQEERGRSTTTAPDGTFVFEAVPEGRYHLGASKSRYVDTAVGARAPGRPGRAFDLARGQKMENVTIVLALAGVITGHVFDDAGDPVAGASVTALQRRTPDGVPRPVRSAYSRSDDTGTYRVFGLAPGRYLLSVAPGEEARHELIDVSGSAFAPTFYPATPIASEAQPLDVAAGAETFADVTLVPTRVTTVSGEVVDAAGRPAMAGMIMLTGKNDAGVAERVGASGVVQAGKFALSGVAPGDYTLNVHAFFDEGEMVRLMGSGGFEGGGYTTPLAVTGAPIADLRIVVPQPVEIAGRVLFEGEPPRGGAAAVTVFATRKVAGQIGPRAIVGPDGRFTLRVLPGAWRMMAWSPGWMPKRLTFRGRVAEDAFAPIDVDAEPGARLDLLLTSQVTVITGTASDADGKLHLDYHVVIFPAERDDASDVRGPRVERADPQGRFRLEAMPPGEYLVAAIADYDPEQPVDEELLDMLRPAATLVRLGEGRTETMTVKLLALP